MAEKFIDSLLPIEPISVAPQQIGTCLPLAA